MVVLLLVASACVVHGQDLPGHVLPALVHGNERFGRALLERVHRSGPDRNVVVSPLSLALILGAVQDSDSGRAGEETSLAFGWERGADLRIASRMLLAAFAKPEVPREPPHQPRSFRHHPEAAWIENAVVYRGHRTLNERFVDIARRFYGVTFASTGTARPTEADLGAVRPSAGTLPQTSPLNDFAISSGTHLQTGWAGNTFSLSEPYQGQFTTASGMSKSVEMLTSEAARYRHARTDRFEAIVLACHRASLIVVLPAPGVNILDLEHDLATDVDALEDVLKPEEGVVAMPPFRIRSQAPLRAPLEAMGIRTVFKDLSGVVAIDGSRLTEINQAVDITVDSVGIRADAETVGGGVYGGLSSAAHPFQMTVDRPFVFLVRDTPTGALLFLGAVVDPSLQ